MVGGEVSAPVNYFIKTYGQAMPNCEQWTYIHSENRVINSVNATGGVTWSQGGYSKVEDKLRELYPNTPCRSGDGGGIIGGRCNCPPLAPGTEGEPYKYDPDTNKCYRCVTGSTYSCNPDEDWLGGGNPELDQTKLCGYYTGYNLCRQKIQCTGGTKMWTINSRLGMKGTVTIVPRQYLKWDITAPVKASFTFGAPDDIPLVGDWNGDGIEGIGAYDPKAGVFFLKNTAGAGVADYAFQYGAKGAVPASWYDTDAKRDGMAVLQGGKWYLDKNLTSGAGEITASSGEVKCSGAGVVSQCLYSPTTSMGAIGAGLALFAGAVYVLFKKKKG